jgi:hypothetical protein
MEGKQMKKKQVKRFNKAFCKDDARHYIIYAELSKMKIDSPYQRAEIILGALKETKLF